MRSERQAADREGKSPAMSAARTTPSTLGTPDSEASDSSKRSVTDSDIERTQEELHEYREDLDTMRRMLEKAHAEEMGQLRGSVLVALKNAKKQVSRSESKTYEWPTKNTCTVTASIAFKNVAKMATLEEAERSRGWP